MRSETIQIGDGWTGTDSTVEKIYQLVEDSLTDPVVVRAARSIVRNVPERDQRAESRAISAYVRRNTRYTRELVETLSTPRLMIDDIRRHGKATGDCDEFTTLWMALHKAVGIQTRAVVISQRADKKGSHIFGQALINGRWVTDDTIVKGKPYGWESPARARTNTKEYGVAGLSGLGFSRKSYQEAPAMKSMNVTIDGPIRKMRSDALAPRRNFILGQSVASRGYKLKPSGMLYVDRRGAIDGVGTPPELGIDISSLISTGGQIAKIGSEVAKNVRAAQQKTVPNPKQPPSEYWQAQNRGIFGMKTETALLVGLGLLFLWKRG